MISCIGFYSVCSICGVCSVGVGSGYVCITSLVTLTFIFLCDSVNGVCAMCIYAVFIRFFLSALVVVVMAFFIMFACGLSISVDDIYVCGINVAVGISYPCIGICISYVYFLLIALLLMLVVV